ASPIADAHVSATPPRARTAPAAPAPTARRSRPSAEMPVRARAFGAGWIVAAVVAGSSGSLGARGATHEPELLLDQQSTVVRVYRPFKGAGINPVLHVRSRAAGFCWTGSEAAFRRRDAWRCLRGGRFIMDPCFAGPNRTIKYVLCPDQAWYNGVLRLELNRPLPPHS